MVLYQDAAADALALAVLQGQKHRRNAVLQSVVELEYRSHGHNRHARLEDSSPCGELANCSRCHPREPSQHSHLHVVPRCVRMLLRPLASGMRG